MGTIRDIDLLECPAGFPTTPWDWGNHVVQPDSRASCFGLKRQSKVRGYSHDPGMTFILERVHSISSTRELHVFLCIWLHDTERTFRSRTSHSGTIIVLVRNFVIMYYWKRPLFGIENRKPYSQERVAHAYLIWCENHSRERLRSSRLVFAVKLANFLMFFVSGEVFGGFFVKKSYLYTVKNITCEYNDENKVENFRVSPRKSSAVLGHLW